MTITTIYCPKCGTPADLEEGMLAEPHLCQACGCEFVARQAEEVPAPVRAALPSPAPGAVDTRRVAGFFGRCARAFAVAAVLCAAWGIVAEIAAAQGTDSWGGWLGLAWAWSCLKTAAALFVISQLLHIRANTEHE